MSDGGRKWRWSLACCMALMLTMSHLGNRLTEDQIVSIVVVAVAKAVTSKEAQ